MTERLTGVVTKWFSDRGFGFIRPDDPSLGARDIWFHAKDVRNVEGRVEMEAGDVVEFTLRENEKGPFAARVYMLEPDDEPEVAAVAEARPQGHAPD